MTASARNNYGLERVSVLICARNYGKYIGACLESVFAQTRCPDEVIVVDDGSTDDTLKIVNTFPGVQYVRQESAGKTAAFNRGFAASTGDVICHLDADDVWRPRKLEKVLPILVTTGAGGVVHEVYTINAEGRRLPRTSRQGLTPSRSVMMFDFRDFLLSMLVYPVTRPRRQRYGMPNSAVVRRQAVEDSIPLPNSIGLGTDIALLLLAARHGLSFVPRKLAGYRWHGTNYYLANRERGNLETMEILHWAEGLASAGRLDGSILGLLRTEREAFHAMRGGGRAWRTALKAIALPVQMMRAGIVPGWKHLALPLGCIVGRTTQWSPIQKCSQVAMKS